MYCASLDNVPIPFDNGERYTDTRAVACNHAYRLSCVYGDKCFVVMSRPKRRGKFRHEIVYINGQAYKLTACV